MSALKNLLQSPTYQALTGERRKAYERQLMISTVIVAGAATAMLIVVLTHRTTADIAPKFAAVTGAVLVLQFLYALVRRETIWQLRVRELRSNAAESTASKAELLEFAAKLQKEPKNGRS